MSAYNNDPEFKTTSVNNAKCHRAGDLLIAGIYLQDVCNSDGDGVANSLTGQQIWAVTAEHFGFPVWLEQLRDRMFESLDKEGRVNWHVDIKQAIPCGFTEAQFEQVRLKFMLDVMDHNQAAIYTLDPGDVLTEVHEGLQGAISFLRLSLRGADTKTLADVSADVRRQFHGLRPRLKQISQHQLRTEEGTTPADIQLAVVRSANAVIDIAIERTAKVMSMSVHVDGVITVEQYAAKLISLFEAVQ